MSHRFFALSFVAGLLSLAWVAQGFVGSHALALSITALITVVYLLGAWELRQFRGATAALAAAVAGVTSMSGLPEWLERVPPALRPAVRGRIEGQARGLPGPALTPYLVGLLVMLGMLGTFLGMVLTFKGAVFALEGSTDVQAMRGALAEPIKGLGLSFGTSVAGVAASAMLGLMSALARRERLEVVRALDACTATVLRPYSPAFQREASLQALQAQASALPQVLAQVQLLLERIEQRHQHLDEQLLARQAHFQDQAAQSYSALASSVGSALQNSLAEGARAAGQSITPLVSAAMAQVVEQSERLHSRLGEAAQTLQAQAGALPQAMAQLQALAAGTEQRSQQLDEQLLARQAHFQDQAAQSYSALATSVGSALQDSLAAGARAAGQSITPVVSAAMAQVVEQSERLHSRLGEVAQNLQAQAGALPQAMAQLQALAAGTEQRSQQLDEQLLARQAHFQDQAAQSYSALATTVGSALQDSLAAGARAAGESLTPVVSAAMAQVVEQAERLHSRLGESAQAQLDGLSAQFSGTAHSVAEQWMQALASHERSSQALSAQLHTALASFGSHFEERSAGLLAQVQAHLQAAQAGQAQAEAQRAGAWTQALHSLASELQAQWQTAAQQALVQQQALTQALDAHARQVAEHVSAQAGRTLNEAQALLSRSEGLVQSRQDIEAQWHAQHGQRMDQLAGVWRQELQALRHDENQRGQAAVERLGALEAAVAQHLASLGASLEAPLNRLLHTAAEVPQAAAGVITQLRQEMGRMGERDNLALQERTALLAQLHTLVQAVNAATGEQRAAIEVLVDAAGAVMQTASERFAQVLDSQARLAQDSATQVGTSAVELASLGDAFGQSVQQFQASNVQLVQGLQRIEQSLNRSTARSDEQLAYYVAQAREVIDLSIASQAGLIEQLRQLQPPPGRALTEGDRA
jgi:hypothetical protein